MRERNDTINSKHKTVKTFPKADAPFEDHITYAEIMYKKSTESTRPYDKRMRNEEYALKHIELAINSGLRTNYSEDSYNKMMDVLKNSILNSLLKKSKMEPVFDSLSGKVVLEQYAQPKKTTGLVGFFQSAYQFLANIATNAFNWITGKQTNDNRSDTDVGSDLDSLDSDELSDISTSPISNSPSSPSSRFSEWGEEAPSDDLYFNDIEQMGDNEPTLNQPPQRYSEPRSNETKVLFPNPNITSKHAIANTEQTTEPSTTPTSEKDLLGIRLKELEIKFQEAQNEAAMQRLILKDTKSLNYDDSIKEVELKRQIDDIKKQIQTLETTPIKPSSSVSTANTAAPVAVVAAPAPAPAPAQAQALPDGNFYANISKEKVKDMLPAKPGIYYVLNDDKLSCIQKELVNGSLITNDDFPTVLLKKIHKKLINEKIGSPTEEASYQLKSEDISDIIRIAGAKYPKEITHAKTDFASEIKRLKGLSDADITFTETPRRGH